MEALAPSLGLLPFTALTDEAGAIALAAGWCAAVRQQPAPPRIMAFGTRQSAWVLVGAARRFSVRRYADDPVPEAELWAGLDAFFDVPSFIAGHIGFDAVWADGTPRPAADRTPTLQFWEPEGVIRIDVPASGSPTVTILRHASVLDTLSPLPPGLSAAVALGPLDGATGPYRDSVALTIDRIQEGESQRLTIARRIDLPADLDLLASFGAPPPDGTPLNRSFYVATPALEMAGHSPELLASGSRRAIDCFKLSGTAPRHPEAARDEELQREFLADAKIHHEHNLSIGATRGALEALGSVRSGTREVLDRQGLRHLLTPLHVDIRPDTPWSRIVRALLPSGAQPRDSGLRSLAELEHVSRGAYYGLVGLRTPEGDCEFSQVLRTLFRDHTGVYTYVGAAVTHGSTVDGETNETRLKLDDIVARRRVTGGACTG